MDELAIYLREDLGKKGDITSDALFTDEKVKAKIICKKDCYISGLEETVNVFKKTGAITKTLFSDGNFISKNSIIAEIKGPARSILKGERLSLNILGRMSAITTETKKLIDLCKPINPNILIAATRKTTPGFRKFEKKAVKVAGGDMHRFGLFDAIMIKDNHIQKIGSVELAIKKIREKLKDKPIEIEIENELDAITAAKLNVNTIMLDNFKPVDAEKIAKKIRNINPDILIEISGGITENNITKYASFADRISLGYITHSVKNIDFSLEFF